MRRKRLAVPLLRLGRIYWRRAVKRFMPTEPQRLFALTIVVGVVAGFAAVAFHLAIHAVTAATIDRATASPHYGWVVWTLLTPALGGLVAGVLLHSLVPNARGSGIPQVKVAYANRAGRIRARDAIGKFFVGAIQIGTGSSLGREGPTVQICAGVASMLGRAAGLSPRSLRRLLPVGAAAGVAAAFNAPISAVTFAIEEIVGTLDQTLLSGIIIAAAFAAVIERSVLGGNPIFDVPPTYSFDAASSLLFYAVLGVAAAGASILFTDSLLAVRKRFCSLKRLPIWAHPAVGGLATGVIAVTALWFLRTGGITGGGYEVLGSALQGELPLKALICLCVMKLGATAMSYGTGGAGGIFAPSLFVGGMLGGVIGTADVAVFGHSANTIGAFALVGMGAVFAGTVRAPMTSVLIIMEMTGSHSLILPLMIANMTSYGLARKLRPTAIYDALLEQDGIRLRGRAVFEALEGRPLGPLVMPASASASFSSTAGAAEILRERASHPHQQVFPVIDRDTSQMVGLITSEELQILLSEPTLELLVTAADVMRAPVSVDEDDDLRTTYELMLGNDLHQLPVLDDKGTLIGMVEESSIASEYVRRGSQTNEHLGRERSLNYSAIAKSKPGAPRSRA